MEFKEVKIEIYIPEEYVKKAIEVIRRVHPYEEPLFNIVPILNDLFE